ncbi:quinoprotein relay system zinc metallohydrolase 2 [Ancylobacter vacuolatus]|uniref:Quinoprotein relay system zinc metallohydrolase 2 n=1 Tax=Ancylobacter vacuolatus TaxID=223389 RepID=A0ABU0DH92_9HYPH|nr:quinoprotein relay system zinc metallohydrolase 2 [Ancylobacter vacuolatus]MDQ0347792.1 quinoprotein relay system zinc metallohydrolase 2 [Ancylobacter vacuolatus]
MLALGVALAAGVGRADFVRAQERGVAALPLEAVADGVHVFRAPYELIAPSNDGAIANMTLIVGEEGAAVIDTGNSYRAGALMQAAVRGVTDKPLRYVINTHMHPDHTLGNAAFEAEGVRFVAHHKMPRALSLRAETYLAQVERLLGTEGEGTRIVLPDLLVEDRLTLDLGGRPLELRAHPTAHTDNDLTVFDVASGTWVMGDLLFVGHIPTLDGSLVGWLDLLDRLAGSAVQRAVPGHGPASVGWPQASDAERRYLAALRRDMRRLLEEGRPISEAPAHAVVSERADWALFDEFNSRNAIAAYHELEWE